MKDKDWLDKVSLGATVYNDSRLHTDFQEDEVLKFVEWLHQQYGIEYFRTTGQQKNMPSK